MNILKLYRNKKEWISATQILNEVRNDSKYNQYLLGVDIEEYIEPSIFADKRKWQTFCLHDHVFYTKLDALNYASILSDDYADEMLKLHFDHQDLIYGHDREVKMIQMKDVNSSANLEILLAREHITSAFNSYITSIIKGTRLGWSRVSADEIYQFVHGEIYRKCTGYERKDIVSYLLKANLEPYSSKNDTKQYISANLATAMIQAELSIIVNFNKLKGLGSFEEFKKQFKAILNRSKIKDALFRSHNQPCIFYSNHGSFEAQVILNKNNDLQSVIVFDN